MYANITETRIREWSLDVFDIDSIQAASLLFQTGYLTVKEVLHGTGSTAYLLDIPNREVREAFNLHILAELTEKGSQFAESAYWKMDDSLRSGDLQKLLVVLQSLMAAIPYNLHINLEAYYHTLFFAIVNILGFDIDVEVPTSMGRIDAVLEIEDKVYIIEFKYKNCAPDAPDDTKRQLFDEALGEGMKQIEDRGYADKYAGSGKAIYKAAFAFLGRGDIEMRMEKSDTV